MNVELRYGEETRALALPADVAVQYVAPREMNGVDHPGEELRRACGAPLDSPPLAERAPREGRVTIAVADLTRGGGTETLLPLLVAELEGLGVERSRVTVLIARGTHRRLDAEEKRFFKSRLLRGVDIVEHDCDDAESLSALLLTRRGSPVRVNRLVREAALTVLLSPVSFHYFAGFGGGRKLVLPGCADRQSIVANHRLSLVGERPARLHPSCRSGNTAGNPVHEDMCETLAALGGRVFAVNFFADAAGRLLFVNAGDPLVAHTRACEAYARVFRVPVERAASVVVLSAGGAPYDVNLVQAHKALRHGARTASEGATILFYARCSEGVGSSSLESALSAERKAFLDGAWKNYELNNQTAVSLLGLTARHRVGMVTELDEAWLRRAGMEPVNNPEAFVAASLETHRADRVAVVRQGAVTLPEGPDKEEG
ncbi:MAG: nickel-dependent lactate racemase, partial [Candidatus Krumholzibacteria bacterium]|nr:nickel-dependent lactate racemase [Candidatus Krumholzibacteria bacterium]